MRRHLVILAKAPRLGRVKRRLVAEIGAVEATRFYRTTLDRAVRRLARDRRWRTVLVVTPEPARWPRGVARRLQARGDLGRRMALAMRDLSPGPVVLVGADVPEIRAAHVMRAFRLLGRFDAVFGPAEDGGYWLVGVRRRPWIRGLFRGVRWSTAHALSDTLANLGPGHRAAFVDTLADVDDAAALRRWRACVAAGRPISP